MSLIKDVSLLFTRITGEHIYIFSFDIQTCKMSEEEIIEEHTFLLCIGLYM